VRGTGRESFDQPRVVFTKVTVGAARLRTAEAFQRVSRRREGPSLPHRFGRRT
jgi:hypothetical protein